MPSFTVGKWAWVPIRVCLFFSNSKLDVGMICLLNGSSKNIWSLSFQVSNLWKQSENAESKVQLKRPCYFTFQESLLGVQNKVAITTKESFLSWYNHQSPDMQLFAFQLYVAKARSFGPTGMAKKRLKEFVLDVEFLTLVAFKLAKTKEFQVNLFCT